MRLPLVLMCLMASFYTFSACALRNLASFYEAPPSFFALHALPVDPPGLLEPGHMLVPYAVSCTLDPPELHAPGHLFLVPYALSCTSDPPEPQAPGPSFIHALRCLLRCPLILLAPSPAISPHRLSWLGPFFSLFLPPFLFLFLFLVIRGIATDEDGESKENGRKACHAQLHIYHLSAGCQHILIFLFLHFCRCLVSHNC